MSKEVKADKFAQDNLIPPAEYSAFLSAWKFDKADIEAFAASINRDPAIVLGRLQHDKLVRFDDVSQEEVQSFNFMTRAFMIS